MGDISRDARRELRNGTKTKMKLAPGLVALALSLNTAFAAIPLYGQCGGQGWTGDTGTSFASCLD